jgi:hypothetical protein
MPLIINVLGLAAIVVIALAVTRAFGRLGGETGSFRSLFGGPTELGRALGIQEDDDAWQHIHESARARGQDGSGQRGAEDASRS